MLHLTTWLVFFDFAAALVVRTCRCMIIFSLDICLLCFVYSVYVFFTCFSCQFCLRLLLVLLLCCLVRPCECIFCCFVTLLCFAVEVRCTGEFVACLVCACVCLMKFFLYMPHANVLSFVAVVAHACLFHERAHTLTNTHTLAHALALDHTFVRCNWFCRFLPPSSLWHDQP